MPVSEILTAVVQATASGDTTIVAADPTRKIKVLHFALTVADDVIVRWKSDGATFLTGSLHFDKKVNTTFISPHVVIGEGWLLETTVNQGLVLNKSNGILVGGYVVYYKEEW